MTDGISIKITTDQLTGACWEVTIPDELLVWLSAVQAMAHFIPAADNDKDISGPKKEEAVAVWSVRQAKALLAELKRRSDEAPSGTKEEPEPGGATVLTGEGPHEVRVEHEGRAATVSMHVRPNGRLEVAAYEANGARFLGTVGFEEPA